MRDSTSTNTQWQYGLATPPDTPCRNRSDRQIRSDIITTPPRPRRALGTEPLFTPPTSPTRTQSESSIVTSLGSLPRSKSPVKASQCRREEEDASIEGGQRETLVERREQVKDEEQDIAGSLLPGINIHRHRDPSPRAQPGVVLHLEYLSDIDEHEHELPRDKNMYHTPPKFASSPARQNSQHVIHNKLRSPRKSIPDRFVPERRPTNELRESYHVSRSPEQLSISERTYRQQRFGPDPFTSIIPAIQLPEVRQLRRPHHTSNSPRSTHVHQRRRRSGVVTAASQGSVYQSYRQFGQGTVWNTSGLITDETVIGTPDGRGGFYGSGTNAPLYTPNFLSMPNPTNETEIHERRLALALKYDQAARILPNSTHLQAEDWSIYSKQRVGLGISERKNVGAGHIAWKDNQWVAENQLLLLDAPHLRDDFYCTLLAYSHTMRCLAVGLGNSIYLWSETKGVDIPEALNEPYQSSSSSHHITSISFSSVQGGQSILSIGRKNGRTSLWYPGDAEPRFEAAQPRPVSCVSFRPTIVKRSSSRDLNFFVNTEELLVGDEIGHLYLYIVEWPGEDERSLFDWHGAMTLVARLDIHTQQICGIAWSSSGEYFATGGNDNLCQLFESQAIMCDTGAFHTGAIASVTTKYVGSYHSLVSTSRRAVLCIPPGREKHKWELRAAVKAIAFCPWQHGLLAIGGGSDDQCIYFNHMYSGARLATIYCGAQITSLVWSTTRREIAATFGFAQPEHPYRIAVFSWPECEQLVSVPWFDENRALYSISYPIGPRLHRTDEERTWYKRSDEEGCLVIAASDAAIRFHEVWRDDTKNIINTANPTSEGGFGGSAILEFLSGHEKEGSGMIR